MAYKTYLQITKFDDKYYCRKNKCFTEKVKLSSMQIYGATNTSKLEEFKNKWEITNFNRYGVYNNFQRDDVIQKIKNINIKKGLQIAKDDEYIKYRRTVVRESLKFKKILFEVWDGYDYYDKSYIKDNLNLNYNNPSFPTIDHKLSILYGFINKISIKDISDISNLCITTRSNNSKKKTKSEELFNEIINTNFYIYDK